MGKNVDECGMLTDKRFTEKNSAEIVEQYTSQHMPDKVGSMVKMIMPTPANFKGGKMIIRVQIQGLGRHCTEIPEKAKHAKRFVKFLPMEYTVSMYPPSSSFTHHGS